MNTRPLSPATNPPPTTPLNILQAPLFAQQASPQLAALYRARVRLLSDLPEASTKGWCCSHCGNLRDGYGWRMVRGQTQKQKKKPAKKERRIKGSKADEPELEIPNNVEAGPSSPSPAAKNALRGKCGMCGYSYRAKGSRSETLATFPPARVVARRTRSSATKEPETDLSQMSIISAPTDIVPDDPVPSLTTHTGVLIPESPPRSTPPSLIQSSPKLAHISISDPTPCTSPFPPTSPSSLPSISTPSSRSASPVGGLPKPTARKKKKSGLAKLLADSAAKKEKERDNLGGLGRWGLN